MVFSAAIWLSESKVNLSGDTDFNFMKVRKTEVFQFIRKIYFMFNAKKKLGVIYRPDGN